MTSPFFVVVFALAAFVVTSTTGKDAVKNVDLAEELEKSRQALAKSHQESEKLHQALEKSHQESEKLRQESAKSHQESEKLRQESAKSHQESEKLRQESVKLRQQLEKSQEETKEVFKQQNKKLQSEDKKLRKENAKLRRQDEELKRRVHELHKADSEIKNSLRQRDQKELELQNVVRSSFREMDSSSEFKKIIYKLIKGYLDENRICVSGMFKEPMAFSTTVVKNHKIEFGQTFRRIPAFAAALSNVYLKTDHRYPSVFLDDFNVTNSSAEIRITGTDCATAYVSWIACL